MISGAAEASQTITLTANGDFIGEVNTTGDGAWEYVWDGNAVGPVEISAVATNSAGQTSSPATVKTELVAPRPRIDAPAHGETFSPGTIAVRGIAQPGVIVDVMNQGARTVLSSTQASDTGAWQTTVELHGEGRVTLSAAAPGSDGETRTSDPVMITLAPAIQPDTGVTLAGDQDEAGRALTALVALLLSASGFSAYFAGRLLFMLAKDRMKPR